MQKERQSIKMKVIAAKYKTLKIIRSPMVIDLSGKLALFSALIKRSEYNY